MKPALVLALCVAVLCSVSSRALAQPSSGLTADEEHRKAELRNRLCADKELSCDYVSALFSDDRLTIYTPPEQAPTPSAAPAPRERERNPYLTKRFGLLTPESLERCHSFVQAHQMAFDAALTLYGVPKEVVCGHLRIETNFGIPTGLSPHPTGTIPAIDRLVTLYVRRAGRKQTAHQFVHRQAFALAELKDLLRAASANDWNLFELPGSSTGAIGLVQFEPSSFNVAVDGDGDHKIDLFDPNDAILSVAHYLSTRGWDQQPLHQRRAIYAYYGGNYDSDPRKYYMKAVLQYAEGMRAYFLDHPVVPAVAALPPSEPLAVPAQDSLSFAFIAPHAN